MKMFLTPIVLAVLVSPIFTQVPPGIPIITGPQVIIFGDSVTLTCTVTGGDPAPTVKWLRNDQMIDESTFTSGGSIVNEYSFTASMNEHLAVFECQSDNGVLQNPLTRTKFVEVYRKPTAPVLTGPTNVVPGTPTTWTCVSERGYPVQTMTMRIGTTTFTSQQFTTESPYILAEKTYTVTGTLNWAPTVANNGQILTCEVTHPQTNSPPQTATLPLTVKSPLTVVAPTTFYNPTEGDTVTLVCQVTDGTPTAIRWYRNNQPITVSGRFSGSQVGGPSLTISNINTADGGTYLCEATDGSATVNTQPITVSVLEKPASEYDIITSILAHPYNKLVRPIDPVVVVNHSLIPKEMLHFNGTHLNFKAMQCINWRDARLSWPRGQPRVSLPSSVIWLPDIVLYGQKIFHDFEAKVIVMQNGDVTWCPEAVISSSNCEEKSGEVFECSFRFLSWSYDIVMLDIYFPSILNRPSIDMTIYEDHDQYEITSRCATRAEMTYPCRVGTYPELTYKFVVRRRRNFCTNLNENPTCN